MRFERRVGTKKAPAEVIVIGGGHNGLTAGCYLADAGSRVTVLEAGDRLGGMTASAPLLPEYPRHLLSQCAIDAVYWRASSVESDLGLDQHGLRFIEHDPAWAWLGPDGQSLVLQRDIGRTIADIRRFSPTDAETYVDFVGAARGALDIQDAYGAGRPDRFSTEALKAAASGIRNKATRSLLGAALSTSAAEVIDGLFESDAVRGAFAAMGNILGSITADGSGIAALATAPLHKYGVGRPVGGMQAIPDALARKLDSLGGTIRLGAEVTSIEVVDGAAQSVTLATGERLYADAFVAAIPPQLVGKMLDSKQTPGAIGLRNAPANAANIGCFKVDIALGGQLSLPHHGRPDGTDMRKPTLMWGSYDQVLAAEAKARTGQISDDLPWWATILSATDPSQAPEGNDVLYLYAPSPVALDGDWASAKDTLAKQLVSTASDTIAGIQEFELGRVVETPLDLEARLGAPNGCIYHVDQAVTRLGPLRPAKGWADSDKHVAGLYLGGAGSHPSGGVSGIPGQRAARAVLRGGSGA
ncbi:phytoene desaturase family protein [Gordonia rubripertincta]|uniref:phytoene desaturase family protein n=1 Tax=Gordonia rubripertincta TaxID=36822 RepID=UPI000B8DB240|nr:NAD(P)/FAD-dependent oxidoreductase [Gordonia rubripertincta]ASR01197.1 Phytoene desaturase (neurosporene-forming) [Gordonia rubripertincta]